MASCIASPRRCAPSHSAQRVICRRCGAAIDCRSARRHACVRSASHKTRSAGTSHTCRLKRVKRVSTRQLAAERANCAGLVQLVALHAAQQASASAAIVTQDSRWPASGATKRKTVRWNAVATRSTGAYTCRRRLRVTRVTTSARRHACICQVVTRLQQQLERPAALTVQQLLCSRQVRRLQPRLRGSSTCALSSASAGALTCDGLCIVTCCFRAHAPAALRPCWGSGAVAGAASRLRLSPGSQAAPAAAAAREDAPCWKARGRVTRTGQLPDAEPSSSSSEELCIVPRRRRRAVLPSSAAEQCCRAVLPSSAAEQCCNPC
jgi:hypothetical protein